MDTTMEDVGRVPLDLQTANVEPTTIPVLDGWIEGLMKCKQLSEADVQRLCEKVCRHLFDMHHSGGRPSIASQRTRAPGRAFDGFGACQPLSGPCFP